MNSELAIALLILVGKLACPAIPELEEMAEDTKTKVDDGLVNVLKVICILTGQGKLRSGAGVVA